MSPKRLKRIVAKIKYLLNVEINEIAKNISLRFQNTSPIFISMQENNCHNKKKRRYFTSSSVKNVFLQILYFLFVIKDKDKIFYLLCCRFFRMISFPESHTKLEKREKNVIF